MRQITFIYQPYVCATLLLSLLCCYSDKCLDLLNEMSKEIGKINIYDIYAPCFNDMETTSGRARCSHIYPVAS